MSIDSMLNFSITMFLTLTEVQVKAFDSCTTSRSLIMEKYFSMNFEFDSCRFYVNVTSLNSNKVQIF